MLYNLITNWILIIPLCAWVIAELIKILAALARGKGLNLSYFIGSGGMPSRVLKNPVLAQNNLSPRHEMGVGFHLFTHFSTPCECPCGDGQFFSYLRRYNEWFRFAPFWYRCDYGIDSNV
jgi:hypothetical protein